MLQCQRWGLVSGLPELSFLAPWHGPGRHLEVLVVPAAEHPSRMPRCPREQASRGMLTARQAGSKEQTIPASLVVHLASCRAVWQPPSLQQTAWQAAEDSASLEATSAHLPAWQALGTRGAPAPSASGVGGRESILQVTARSLSKLGRGWRAPNAASFSHQRITVLQAAIEKLSLNHVFSRAVPALYQRAGVISWDHGHTPSPEALPSCCTSGPACTFLHPPWAQVTRATCPSWCLMPQLP